MSIIICNEMGYSKDFSKNVKVVDLYYDQEISTTTREKYDLGYRFDCDNFSKLINYTSIRHAVPYNNLEELFNSEFTNEVYAFNKQDFENFCDAHGINFIYVKKNA